MDFLTEENRHPVYGEDNLPDPWEHPGIHMLQKACHPFLALDVEFWQINRASNAWGHFPVQAIALPANTEVTREITVFNDEWSGTVLEFVWELREGSLANHPLAEGRDAIESTPGFRKEVQIQFRTPRFNTYVFLTLRVFKDGVERFCDDLTCYETVGGENFKPEFNGEERKFL
jgi:hypothetical protein